MLASVSALNASVPMKCCVGKRRSSFSGHSNERDITRFKGLGEISPGEFKQFTGPAMRLSQVEYAPRPDSQQILGFYMGKNTPERKDYIMANLVVPVEE